MCGSKMIIVIVMMLYALQMQFYLFNGCSRLTTSCDNIIVDYVQMNRSFPGKQFRQLFDLINMRSPNKMMTVICVRIVRLRQLSPRS